MGEFRAVRFNDSGPFLTGVGLCIMQNGVLAVPGDESKRYDDYGYTAPLQDHFSLMITDHRDPDCGYAFHESCWKILKALVYPSPVPIQTLYNICRSCPITRPGHVELGLDYCGVTRKDPNLPYPWEGFHIMRNLPRELGWAHSAVPGTKIDPFDIPELQQFLGETQQPMHPGDASSGISPSPRRHTDCFSSLPPELLEEIRVLLPSRSVVNLHSVSRSFASLPLSQYFWASRFMRRRERSHIFEPIIPGYVPDTRKNCRDWRALYHKTAEDEAFPGALENRARVWNSTRGLRDLLIAIPPVRDEAVQNFSGVDTETQVWEAIPGWRYVGGDFRYRSMFSSAPCYVRFKQNVNVPENITQIAVSIVDFHNREYISGLRLISHGRPDIKLGYESCTKQVILDVMDRDGRPGIFTGFICALGARGIQGLRVVTSDGRSSEWAGSPSGLPQTLRLCVEQPISELKAAFDGFKMVGLAVPELSGSDTTTINHRDTPLPLKSHAIWYPDIPSKYVSLHNESHVGNEVSSAEYLPVLHCMFGGPKGIYLKYLTQISAVCNRAIVGLEFLYEHEGSPVRFQKLHCLKNSHNLNRINFRINGPGGEVVTEIKVGYGYRRERHTIAAPQQRVTLTSFRVETNHGRKFDFMPAVMPVLGPRPKSIIIPPGRTITGLFAIDDFLHGMSDFGAMTEVLDAHGER
ncbi:hypothetical protein FQN54_003847 [Arachnomyces sp. PD_36]|nr:hypothetical protein FQN54_003847 [Arachnomyces sp. PD_36]